MQLDLGHFESEENPVISNSEQGEVEEIDTEVIPEEIRLEHLNRQKYPFYRAIFNTHNIDTLERVNFSYVKLPDDFVYGEASGRRNYPIETRELNDKYIGVG
jgi:hypothetical protein